VVCVGTEAKMAQQLAENEGRAIEFVAFPASAEADTISGKFDLGANLSLGRL